MSIQKKSLISTLDTTKKANVVKGSLSVSATPGKRSPVIRAAAAKKAAAAKTPAMKKAAVKSLATKKAAAKMDY